MSKRTVKSLFLFGDHAAFLVCFGATVNALATCN